MSYEDIAKECRKNIALIEEFKLIEIGLERPESTKLVEMGAMPMATSVGESRSPLR